MRTIEKKATVKSDTGEDWWVWVLGPSDRPDGPQRRSVQFYPLDDEATFDRDALIEALGLVELGGRP